MIDTTFLITIHKAKNSSKVVITSTPPNNKTHQTSANSYLLQLQPAISLTNPCQNCVCNRVDMLEKLKFRKDRKLPILILLNDEVTPANQGRDNFPVTPSLTDKVMPMKAGINSE